MKLIKGFIVCFALLLATEVYAVDATTDRSASSADQSASLVDRFIFSFNVPVEFNQSATFKKGIIVGGDSISTTGKGEFAKLTAGNILYGVKAGTGVSVTDSQNPTITNTGVLSLGGKTGTLSLSAESGISVDGLKITSSDTGSAQNIFKTIASLGQTSIAASSNTDTLTVVGTGGITLTTDSTTKTLTIDAQEPDYTLSGWGKTGAVVGLTTTTDSVVMDSVLFGNATITNGKSILPETDLTSNLGTDSLRFDDVWVANINSNSSQSFTGQTTFSYPPTDTTNTQATVLINPASSVANGQLLGFAVNGYQKALMDAEGDMVLGYSGNTSAPVTAGPLTVYGHNGTQVLGVDTSGNMTLAGGVQTFTDATHALTIANMLNVDTTNDRVGIGTTAPTATMSVVGDVASQIAAGIAGLKILDSTGVSKLAMAWDTGSVTLDMPTSKIINSGFETDLTGWTGNILNDQFSDSGPTTLVSGGVSSPTPALGTEMWDADAATFTSGVYHWTPLYGTIVNEAGTLKITSLGTNQDNGRVYLENAADLSSNLTIGSWYQIQTDAKVAAGSHAYMTINPNNISNYLTNTSWETKYLSLRASSTSNDQLYFNHMYNNGETIWIDNLSLKSLTLTSLFSTISESTINKIVSTEVTLTNGTAAGLVLNLDSASNPQNFVIAYHDGNQMHLEKNVGGTYTSLIRTNTTYVPGATLKVAKAGTSYTLIYNGAQVGSTQTIADAGIVNNTLQGLFSTYASNSFSNFLITTNLSGSLATDGVNTRTVTDTGNKLSIGGGVLNHATGGTASDKLQYASQTRTAGKVLSIGNFNPNNDYGWFGLVGSTTYRVNHDYWASNSLKIEGVSIENNPSLSHSLAVVMRNTGLYWFIKDANHTNWTLMWIGNSGSENLSPAVGAIDTGSAFTADNIKIPANLWLPTPLAYDTFATNGATSSETIGPDGQTTSALSWTGAITKSGGTMSITPTMGSDVITNGTFDNDTGWNHTSDWVISGGVATKNPSSNAQDLIQTAGSIGTWYSIDFTVTSYTAGNVQTRYGATGPLKLAAGTFTETGRSTANTLMGLRSGASANLSVDNISFKPLTLSSLFSTVSTSDSDVVMDTNVTLTAGTQAGFVLNLDSASNPQNFVIAYNNGSSVILEKVVNGAYTTLFTTTVNSSNGVLRVIKDGTKYRVYYNNALVGTEQTITDEGIISNTKHGLFSTYAGNTFDNFSLFARGTGGEYTVGMPDQDLTATRDTSVHYAGNASLKLVAGANDNSYTQSVTLPDTTTYALSAYAYTTGAAVTTEDLDLSYDGNELATTFTSVGNGWYKLSGTFTGVASAKNYGVKVHAGKTVYVDSIALYATSGAGTQLKVANSLTGLAQLNVESTTTLNSGLASLQALIVKGFSGQTANLQEWQSSTGTVLGAVDALGGLSFARSTNSTTAYSFNNSSGTSVLDVDTTNSRVGIGTTAPSEALDVTGNIKASGTLTSITGTLNLGSNSISGTTNLAVNTAGALSFGTGGTTDDMFIFSAGLVGIGTTAPTAKLDVVGTIASEANAGVEALKIIANGVSKLALRYDTDSSSSVDTQSSFTNNKFTNTTFDSGISGWDYGNALEDQFTTAVSAGSVNGTLATDGVNTRTVTDTNNKLSVTGGVASFATGGSAANPGILYSGTTRAAGEMLIETMTVSDYTTMDARFGLGRTASVIAPKAHQIKLSAGTITLSDDDTTLVNAGTFSNQTYTIATILRSTGAYYYIKGGTYTNWTLLWIGNLASTTPIYPVFADYGGAFTADNIKIPTNLWLPTPLAYDTFTTDGATSSETTGPDGQTTAALAWTGGTKSGGTMSITPTVSTELLADTGFDNDASWTKTGSGVSVSSSKGVFTSSANGGVNQSVRTVGKWYQESLTADSISGGTLSFAYLAGGSSLVTVGSNTVFGRAVTTTSGAIQVNTGTVTAVIDNFSIKELTLSSLFSTVPTSTANVIADVTISALTAGTQAGLVLNLDSTSNPANFIIVYHDGSKLYVDEAVGGVYTNKQNTTVALGAGALRVTRDGTKLRVYLNNALVGSELTMTANTNTNHGMFSTYAGNTFDNFSLFARGTGNEYTDLPETNLVPTAETTKTYGGTPGSVKLVAGTSGSAWTQSVNVGDTASYTLSAAIYTTGSAVTSADAELISGGNIVPTTYTAIGGGWYRMSGTVTGVASAKQYGVQVHAGKTVYLDNLALFATSQATSTFNVQNTLTGLGKLAVESTTTLNSGLASLQALIVKGALSQAANLSEWQTSTGSVLGSVSAEGSAYFAGNVGIGTAIDPTKPITTATGAYLSSTGVWTDNSSVALKENFTAIDNADLLNKIAGLSIERWNYKSNDTSITHIGPTAEEFASTFGVGEDNQHIAALDTAGIALAGVKALIEKVNNLFTNTVVFQGKAAFRSVTEYFDTVVYNKNMQVKGVAVFNSSTAGQAIISKDTASVHVVFTTPFETAPIVTFSQVDSEIRDAYLQDVTTTGFSIAIPDAAFEDYTFNWIALAPIVKTQEATQSATLSGTLETLGDSEATPSGL